MIRQVFFSNFRALRNVEVSLGPLTVIVGPNASGKTTMLKGLQYLLEAARETNPYEYFEDDRNPLLLASRSSVGRTRVGIETQNGMVSFEFSVPKGITFDTLYQQVGTPPDWKLTIMSRRHRQDEWTNIQEDAEFLADLPDVRLLKLEPVLLASASSPTYSTEIDERGEGLASALWLLHGKEYDVFKELEKHLCAVIPSVKRIRFDRIPTAGPRVRRRSEHRNGGGMFGGGMGGGMFGGGMTDAMGPSGKVGETLLFDTTSAEGVPATCMSDGTLLVLGLLAVLYTTKRPRLILLDDLERGLHPRAQRDIVPLLRSLLKTSPGLQIVATSHSPYLVDVLEPEEVRLTTIANDGQVRCQPLQQHPEFKRWKDEMSPGEFWSAVGEKWVTEQAGQP